jgi:16S rRNA (guanine527-N7)-methyltransferase
MAQFEIYATLLADWQQRMNLVGPATLPDLWRRHFVDSAQLLPLAGRGKTWLDIGAGGGFPGLVIALLDPTARLTLVESIAKKCGFLRAVAEATGTADWVTIANVRIEALPRQTFDIITARACAALSQLFDWGLRFAGPSTLWVLPKGARVQEEIEAASQAFVFERELVASRTEPAARIVLARGVRRR